ncbi:MAG: SulP family inorganic anion transporter [Actinomyces sp.]|nr:SulP family inorganic anion transporter [Actinomyces sp.]
MRLSSSIADHLKFLLPSADDYREANWRRDLVAGVTVGIVALPLALAFGVSSGVGAAAGLVTAIVAGLIAAVFGGSHVQVSGPTGAMVVILAPIVAQHGASSIMLLSVMAGLMVFAFGLLGLGKAISLIPWSVVEGFTLGIATLIALQQVPMAMGGVEIPAGVNSLYGAFLAVQAADWAVSAFTLGIVLVTVLMIVGTSRISTTFPASLVAVVVVSLAAFFGNLAVPTIGQLPSSLPAPSLPYVDFSLMRQLLPAAFAVAMLAAIESLLSARVAAGMPGQGSYQPDRELVGQGLASIGSGIFGGMPATGAIARTAVNVKSGATSRVSAIVHAIILGAVVYLAAGLVSHIPLAALAGVLFVTAFRMVSTSSVCKILGSTRGDGLVFWITALITVVFDLVVAIGLGVAIAVFWAVYHLSRLSGVVELPLPGERQQTDDKIAYFRLDGSMFFGAAERIVTELSDVHRSTGVVILSMSHVGILDASGAKQLSDVFVELNERGIITMIKGLRPEHLKAAQSVGIIDALSSPTYLFDSIEEAAASARRLVAEGL